MLPVGKLTCVEKSVPKTKRRQTGTGDIRLPPKISLQIIRYLCLAIGGNSFFL
jgi:hypothetical protein